MNTCLWVKSSQNAHKKVETSSRNTRFHEEYIYEVWSLFVVSPFYCGSKGYATGEMTIHLHL